MTVINAEFPYVPSLYETANEFINLAWLKPAVKLLMYEC